MIPTATLLPDGRLHLNHAGLDIVVSADGGEEAVEVAFKAAAGRFASLVAELVDSLPLLRRAAHAETELSGLLASRMARAVAPHAETAFMTPMCAACGAMADEILDAMTAAAPLRQAFVNNGGDIAVHIAGGQTAHAIISPHEGDDRGTVRLTAGDGIGGIATAGRRGRRFALGLADTITVLAASAAEADAAATVLSAGVDLTDHPAAERVPAHTLDPDSDLGSRLVVIDCLPLTEKEKTLAVAKGARLARAMLAADLIRGVAFSLQGYRRALGWGDLVSGSEAPPIRGGGARRRT